jgi:chorismate synthase
MAASLGHIFRVSLFGESHGRCIGTVIDGCPAGLAVSTEDIQRELDKRRSKPASFSTPRTEADRVEVFSGIFNGYTTGAPICLLVWNRDVDSSKYHEIRYTPRPGHADFTAFVKYGGFSDYRGGGRFSGRITAGFVMAGAIARKLLALLGTEILAYTTAIGDIKMGQPSLEQIKVNTWTDPLRCPTPLDSQRMLELIQKTRDKGDSVGGTIEGLALGVPAGLGEPICDTLEGDMAKALFAIPAVKGVEFGTGFAAAEQEGSANNDAFIIADNHIMTETNNAGGVLGGISNGMPIVVRVAIKPTPSISRPQKTVNVRSMQETTIEVRGRHDACIVPRAVIVVESMMAIALCDFAQRAQLLPDVIEQPE